MARGSQESGAQGQLIYANIKGTKEGEKVHFVLTRSNPADPKSPIAEGTEKKLTGTLVYAAHRPWTYQEKSIDGLVLILSDPAAGKEGESYRVEVSNIGSGIGRSIINSLLSATQFLEPITLSLYNSKEGGYANVGVYQGGDPLKWKYSIEEQAEFISISKKKEKDAKGKIIEKDVRDYTDLNEKLLKEFKEQVIPKVSASRQQHGSSKPNTENTPDWADSQQEGASVPAQDDGLPWK
jgi:hypothetical protein